MLYLRGATTAGLQASKTPKTEIKGKQILIYYDIKSFT
jgi:hypothetical protein